MVLADDLIWATRLAAHLRASGAVPVHVRDAAAFEAALAGADRAVADRAVADRAVVDLTARAYDGVAAVEAASRAGWRVLAVGQHDDLALRKAALAAGADRVYSYRKLFEDGPATLGRWLAGSLDKEREAG